MINTLFSPTAGSGGLALTGLEVTSVEMAAAGTVVAHVGTASPASVQCPDCGARRHVTGARVVRFKDIPRGGHAVALSWRRRHFVCTGCHRPSHETLAVLEERHRVTTRLVDWIWQQAGQATFIDLARRCGLSQRTVIVLFQAARRRDTVVRSKLPYNLGAAILEIAGLPRPVLCDVATGAVVDIYRSLESFADDLDIAAMHTASSHSLTLDLGLHEVESHFTAAFQLDRFLVSPQSAGRLAAELMMGAAREAIAAQAARDGKAAKTRMILFSRRRNDLGRIGVRRLRTWSRDAAPISDAYDFKERFLELCTSWRPRGWLDWKAAWEERAAGWPKSIDGGSTKINYARVIALIDRYAEAMADYQKKVAAGEFRKYERTLAELAELVPTGTRSFAGARAAILQKFGRRPDGGDGGVEGEARGDEPSL